MKYKFVVDRLEDVVELDYPEGEVATDYGSATVEYKFVGNSVQLTINEQFFTREDLRDIIEVFEAMKEKIREI